MSLFQTSVIKKYLSGLSPELIDKKYHEFQSFFGNAERQENIRNSKEEEFQSGFISALFVNILGYILNPEPNFNIVLEKKNVDDSKKADGAIIRENEVIAVIELKSTQTTNLDSFRDQAFGYKNHNPKCVYIITSNFEKIRLYIHDTTNHLEFDLFNLSKEDFALLWLCFSKDNILNDIPLKIKEASVLQEENVTKELYNDYSKFREEIFNDIVKNNPEFDKLILFKKTQKLLDRFLFIFFAEDRLLLPPNSISEIVQQWNDLKDKYDEYFPLYERFKKYFGYLNKGFKGKKYDIFAYNGGLFLPDEILDNIKIEDDILHKHTLKLSKYDFETDVDVNILGHIFEHSLGEIENVQAEIAGEKVDQLKTKRKKDGIFYTPKYITKYIVENTVGKLCEEKRNDLGIIDEEYAKGRKNRKKDIVRALDDKLTEYRDWLLEITILDPACGSGAFLNQALEFLIQEHKKIDELKAQLLGGSIVFPDIEAKILEKNIYGVDLNEESVEIAKLSLWLRTAQKGRKLTTLSNHIKCGNSLIDAPEVAGEKAFNWQNEFPEVFANGGFNVVIGNPPYVRQELFKDIKPYLENHYKCYNSIADLYTYFIEKGIELMSKNGLFSFILPNKFLKATYGKQIRQVIKEESTLKLIFDFDDYPVFEEATTYPIIFVLSKKKSVKDYFLYSEINNREKTSDPISLLELKKHKVSYSSLADEMWSFINVSTSKLLEKIALNTTTLKDVVDKKIFRGITTGKNEAFIIDEIKKDELIRLNPKNADLIKILATGKEIKRNTFNFNNKYLLFTGYDVDIPQLYPDIYKELENYKEDLIKRYDKGANYWNLRACAYYSEMQEPKIIYPRINNKCNFYLDEKGEVFLLDNNFFISSDSKSLLALLNSKLVYFYLSNICTTLQGGFYDFRRDKITTIPVSNQLNNDVLLSEKSTTLIDLMNNYNLLISKFQKYLNNQIQAESISKRLQHWYDLEFSDFIKEYNKSIKNVGKEKLTKDDEIEWMEVFEKRKTEIQVIKTEIKQTEIEIDQMVYELYNLSEEEIKIIEDNS